MSQWRARSNEVIQSVLASLSPDAPVAVKRKALQAAYPFGVRQHHPYKVWCAAVRKAIGPARVKTKQVPDVGYYVRGNWWHADVRCDPREQWWGVQCECVVKGTGTCLMCRDAYDLLKAFVLNDRTRQLVEVLRRCNLSQVRDSADVLSDHMIDCGMDRLADEWRKAIPPDVSVMRHLLDDEEAQS